MTMNVNSVDLISWLRSLKLFDFETCASMVALHEDVVLQHYLTVTRSMQMLSELEDYVKYETGN